MLEFDAGVIGCELPVGFGVMGIAFSLPCGDLANENLFVGDAATETLRRENGEFGFRHIEPTAVLWRVMPFETLDEPPCFGGGKSFVERGWPVGAEIVLHENDFPGIRKVSV